MDRVRGKPAAGTRGWIAGILAMVHATLAASLSHAQTPAEFYKGKTLDIYIGYTVGGGYDLYARLLARHIGEHIPGKPTVVPRNMEGAGSLRLANWLYNAAPKDGLSIGTIARGAAFDPLLIKSPAQFDAQKFNWIGSMNDEVSLCVSWKDTGVTKFEDLYDKPLVVGGTGASADDDQFPRALNSVLGTKFSVVTAYRGGSDVVLAMERGEVKGRCGWSWSSLVAAHPHWVKDKTINLLAQLSLAKHTDLPDVPLILDFAKTDEQRQILKLIFSRQVMGRPFLAPPDVPEDRVAALRKAFMDTMKDPAFLAEAQKAKLEITPVSGADLQKLVQDIYAQPKEIAERASKALAQ
jgi:tripartite-type tricarboxylate transporter receptor subunit TctC